MKGRTYAEWVRIVPPELHALHPDAPGNRKAEAAPAGKAKAPKPRGPHRAGEPNDLERAYADEHLEPRLRAGEIKAYEYEPERLRLADRTTLTVDWRVERPDGTFEFHEVKGWFEPEDGWVKLKVAAALYPEHTFYHCSRKKKSAPWVVKRLPSTPAGRLDKPLKTPR